MHKCYVSDKQCILWMGGMVVYRYQNVSALHTAYKKVMTVNRTLLIVGHERKRTVVQNSTILTIVEQNLWAYYRCSHAYYSAITHTWPMLSDVSLVNGNYSRGHLPLLFSDVVLCQLVSTRESQFKIVPCFRFMFCGPSQKPV